VSDLTPEVVEDWLSELIATDGQTRRVEHAYETLYAGIGVWCKRRCNPNPVAAIPHPEIGRPKLAAKDRALTHEQYDKLRSFTDNLEDRVLLRLATETMMRRGELCALQRGDIHLVADGDGSYVHIQRTLCGSGFSYQKAPTIDDGTRLLMDQMAGGRTAKWG